MKWKEKRTKLFSKILVLVMFLQLFTPFLEMGIVAAKDEKDTIIDKLEIVGGVPEEGYWPGDLINIRGDWSLLDDSPERVYGDGYKFTVEIPEGFTPIGNTIILGNMGQGEINKENNTIEFTFNENINHRIDRKGGFNLHLKVDGPEDGYDNPDKKNLILEERSDGNKNLLDIENLGNASNEIIINAGKRPEPEPSGNISALHKVPDPIIYAIGKDGYERDKVQWHIDINPSMHENGPHNMVGFKEGVLEDSVVNDNHEIDKDSFDVLVEDIRKENEPGDLKNLAEKVKKEILVSIRESNKKGFSVKLEGLDRYRYIIRYKTKYIGNPMLDMNSDDYSMEKGILNLKNKASLTPTGDEGEAIENHTTGELLLNGWAEGRKLIEFELEKKDSFNKDISLSGAEFELYFYDDFIKGDRENPIRIKDNNDGVYKIVSPKLTKVLPIFDKSSGKLKNVETTVVDSNGNILPGRYVLVETKAPEGYELDMEPKFIDIEADDDGKFVYEVENTPSVDIKINKNWENFEGKNLEKELREDVVVSVFKNEDQNPVRRGVLQKDQDSIEFKNLPAYDEDGNTIEYHIEEETKLDNFEEPVIDKVETKKIKDGHDYYQEYTVTNKMKEPKGNFTLKKVDVENNNVIKGSEFKLIQIEDKNKEKLNKVIEDSIVLEDGSKELKDLEIGKYKLEEIKAPENYKKLDDSIEFEVDNRGNINLISEDPLLEFSKDENELKVSNIALTNVRVKKQWDGLAGEKAEVELHADGKKINEAVLNEGNNWEYKFKALDKTDKYGEEINYEVKEVNVPENYETTVEGNKDNGFVVKNTYVPEKMDIKVEKEWIGLAGEKAEVELHADGEKIKEAVLNEGNNWKYKFEDLDKTDKYGKEINYEIKEVNVPGNYESTVEGNKDDGFVVKNTYIPEKMDIKVEKEWIGLAGEKAEVELHADGKKINEAVLNEGNNWKYKFKALDKTDINGKEIKYEVKEVNVPGNYETDIKGSAEKGFKVINTFIPEERDIIVEKLWDGLEGKKAKIELFADNEKVDSAELSKDNGWKYIFEDLKSTDIHGNLINYHVEEVDIPDNYEVSYERTSGHTLIINTYIPEKIGIKVAKEWIGLAGEKAEVELHADGKKINKAVLNEGNNWEYEFEDLDKTDKYGKEINYEIKEVNVPGNYESTVEDNKDDGFVVKNTYIPEKRDLLIEKIWDGKPQDEASFILYKDNEKYSEVVVLNEENNWKHIFEDLETTDIYGNPIKYHVKEVDVPGNYEVSYKETSDGIAIINSFIPEKTEVSVRKLWEGRKLDKVRVELIGNREVVDVVTLSNSNNWQHTFNNVDKTDKFENPIYYTVREIDVPEGYTVSYEGGNKDFTITNKETMPIPPIEKIDLEVEKKWDGKVLDQVEVELLADGSVVDRVKLSESNDWVYKFEDLDATDIDGTEIEYEVRETNVPEGYRVDYKRIDNKFIITNTEEQLNEKIDIKVIKKWLDSNGRDLTKSYKAPKIQDKALELPAISNDSDLKEELPIKEEKIEEIKKDEFEEDIENNEEIKLETEELEEELIDEVPEEIKVDEDIEDRSEPDVEKISYTTIKDNVSEDELRDLEKSLDIEEVEEINLPESIEVTLKANGKVLKTVRVKESDNWEYIFKNLDKYDENGNEIKYTISETPVEGFKTTYSKDGFTIINTKIDEGTDPVEPTDPEDNGNSEHEDGENKPHYPTPEDNEKDPGTTNGENKPGNTTKPNDMDSLDNSKKPQKVDKPNQSINKGSLPATGSKSQIGTYILGVSMILLGIALRRKNK